MSEKVIDYYLTMNSPWSYMGAGRLAVMANNAGCKVNVYPTNFLDVFSSTGGLPLGKRSPERKAYRLAEIKRWAKFLDLPVVVEPAHFPADDKLAARAVCAAQMAGLNALALSLELGRAQWELEEDYSQMRVVAAACLRAGIEISELGDLEPVGVQIETNTRIAVERGVFGFPAYLVDGEMYWGQDRLDFLERHLNGLN